MYQNNLYIKEDYAVVKTLNIQHMLLNFKKTIVGLPNFILFFKFHLTIQKKNI